LDFLYLQSDKPLALTDRRDDTARLNTEAPISRATPIIDGSTIDDVEETFAEMLTDDRAAHARHDLRCHYFGEGEKGTSTALFTEAVSRLIADRSIELAQFHTESINAESDDESNREQSLSLSLLEGESASFCRLSQPLRGETRDSPDSWTTTPSPPHGMLGTGSGRGPVASLSTDREVCAGRRQRFFPRTQRNSRGPRRTSESFVDLDVVPRSVGSGRRRTYLVRALQQSAQESRQAIRPSGRPRSRAEFP